VRTNQTEVQNNVRRRLAASYELPLAGLSPAGPHRFGADPYLSNPQFLPLLPSRKVALQSRRLGKDKMDGKWQLLATSDSQLSRMRNCEKIERNNQAGYNQTNRQHSYRLRQQLPLGGIVVVYASMKVIDFVLLAHYSGNEGESQHGYSRRIGCACSRRKS
jgi:hypothetical protein